MNEDISKLREQIEGLQNQLRIKMHECPHTNAKLYPGRTSGGYYDAPEDYIYVACDDCGIKYTYEEDSKMYDELRKRL